MIRPAQLSDIDGLLPIAAAMHAESRFRVLDFSPDKMRSLFEHLAQNENGCLLVVEHEGGLHGVLAGGLAQDFFGQTVAAFEYGVYVSPARRGSMDGVRLVKAYLAWARERGALYINMGVTTGVTTDRTGALYERLGARKVGDLYSWGL
ncbi:GNAT family N-acetyltransferase [Achromobacter sp.]|uniref:GNAT family N-acetyltransferase n=1 Tax=Achromobacter sp. TaxID=134375 RepID=UPI000EBFBC4F|nr:GNAT family N-acetyltransferase [Achromobacter sp.]HCW18831.1 N-acetyltransferase [Achromobacter sp.]